MHEVRAQIKENGKISKFKVKTDRLFYPLIFADPYFGMMPFFTADLDPGLNEEHEISLEEITSQLKSGDKFYIEVTINKTNHSCHLELDSQNHPVANVHILGRDINLIDYLPLVETKRASGYLG